MRSRDVTRPGHGRLELEPFELKLFPGWLVASVFAVPFMAALGWAAYRDHRDKRAKNIPGANLSGRR